YATTVLCGWNTSRFVQKRKPRSLQRSGFSFLPLGLSRLLRGALCNSRRDDNRVNYRKTLSCKKCIFRVHRPGPNAIAIQSFKGLPLKGSLSTFDLIFLYEPSRSSQSIVAEGRQRVDPRCFSRRKITGQHHH